jgi:hypothetical protein
VRDGEALVRQPVNNRSGETRVVLDKQNLLFHDSPREPPPAAAGMDRSPIASITTQPADQREASPPDEADFMCGADGPARGATMKGILGFLNA